MSEFQYNKVIYKHTKDMPLAIQNVYRCTGKTTGIALELIGQAMQEPNKPIKLECLEYPHNGEHSYRYFLMHTVSTLISNLELDFFVFNRKDMTMCYKPIGKVKQGWEIIE